MPSSIDITSSSQESERASNSSSNQDSSDMERELADMRGKHMVELLKALEDLPFTSDIDEWGCSECVICLEQFQENETIKRIPTCRHYFHPVCVESWYKGKVNTDEQRCPQCNVTLNIAAMKKAAIENKHKRTAAKKSASKK